MRPADFSEIWVVDFEFHQRDGELPAPLVMVAKEVRSGVRVQLRREELDWAPEPPFGVDGYALVVGFYLPAEFSCFLQLGWPRPVHAVDLCTEFKRLRAGSRSQLSKDLVGALTAHNLGRMIPAGKSDWQNLAIRGGPYTAEEMDGLVDYCTADVDATAALFRAMEDQLDLPRALVRGRYSWSVAKMEAAGVPIDTDLLDDLRRNWEAVKARLIRTVDKAVVYGPEGNFREARFESILLAAGIHWPRHKSGRLVLDDDTFRKQSRAFPEIVGPYHELRTTLSKLRLNELAVGEDGRNRAMLSPFGATTSRNTPSNSKFVFGPARWIRGLIKPTEGNGLAYVDWEQQELGIAAALSGDRRMMNAYASGDPYVEFGKLAGVLPDYATKRTHPAERDRFKVCMLGVGYGMREHSLANLLGRQVIEAKTLLQQHRDTFPAFWAWSDRIEQSAFLRGRLWSVFGWQRWVKDDAKPTSIRNWPVQTNGAEMLRLAVIKAQDAGVVVCAPVHDAILVEAPLGQLSEAVHATREAMLWASQRILSGFSLRTEAQLVAYPDRYMDKSGEAFWNTITRLLEEVSPGNREEKEEVPTTIVQEQLLNNFNSNRAGWSKCPGYPGQSGRTTPDKMTGVDLDELPAAEAL